MSQKDWTNRQSFSVSLLVTALTVALSAMVSSPYQMILSVSAACLAVMGLLVLASERWNLRTKNNLTSTQNTDSPRQANEVKPAEEDKYAELLRMMPEEHKTFLRQIFDNSGHAELPLTFEVGSLVHHNLIVAVYPANSTDMGLISAIFKFSPKAESAIIRYFKAEKKD